MRTSTWLATTLAAVVGTVAWISLPVEAVRLSDGRVYFVQPPRLTYSATTRNLTSAPGATYYFTLTVPDNAGEPLQRVAIAQENGSTSSRLVRYELDETRAFTGTRGDRGEALTLADTTFDRDTQTVTVTFDPPVPPGTTVTIGLRPDRNPNAGGTYLFGVTAYPAGDTPYGQFLGYGRFQFDEPNHIVPF
ncbi:DUF2808 domain-containing protein [Oscillatoria sp. FACHB-1407]|uniref:DUF2808 domain-containing protein n=1 Tax=Oscillatoria sp. FACHB-1407 TaxID=2692847 RepID=UPI001684B5D0|nr:DUF2808 domain-containing protein [Oscillatoria sp. FACHB-1407]MBD2464661.1 DUF2808 domain-containing protein [Oscillatoria sp. FACHB-1407]